MRQRKLKDCVQKKMGTLHIYCVKLVILYGIYVMNSLKLQWSKAIVTIPLTYNFVHSYFHRFKISYIVSIVSILVSHHIAFSASMSVETNATYLLINISNLKVIIFVFILCVVVAHKF